jgi:predicted PurR-regulated permease PerM
VILVVATWPAFDRLRELLGGRRTLAALVMVTLATLVFVVPPALIASSIAYNVAGTIRLLSDVSQRDLPPPPLAWVAGINLIGPEIHDRWQVLAAGGPEAAERIRTFVVWIRQQLIAAGLSLGNAVVQLILAVVMAFFLYRDGAAAPIAAGRRIAGDEVPHLLRVAYATINGVVYGVLATALAQALLIFDRAVGHRHPGGAAPRPRAVPAGPHSVRAGAGLGTGGRPGPTSRATSGGRSLLRSGASRQVL